MNKRIAKKRYKKAIDAMLHGRKVGTSVLIKNMGVVDEHGKECDISEPGARAILFKRPQIQYFRH